MNLYNNPLFDIVVPDEYDCTNVFHKCVPTMDVSGHEFKFMRQVFLQVS